MTGALVPTSRTFLISDVLSVTTQRLVSTRGMDAVYDVMGYVLSDPGITTIGLIAMADIARDAILAQHPQIAGVVVPEGLGQLDIWHSFLKDIHARFGERLTLTPMKYQLANTVLEN